MDFCVLGPLEVRDDEGAELALAAGRQQALLVALLLNANEVVLTDRLVDELWGERVPPTAVKAIHNHVSQLRRTLGDARLLTHGHGYVLAVGPGELDLQRFEQLVDEGTRALEAGDAGPAASILRGALALWRGPALGEFAYESFAEGPALRLEELRLGALEKRIEADLALGRHAELIGELEELVSAHPLRERFRAQLMLALYRSGRQAEALEAYREETRILDEELGLEPGDELRELERAILRQDEALGPAARTPVFLRRAARRGGLARSPLTLAASGILLLVLVGAAVAALVLTSGGTGPVPIAPDSVVVIDPASNRILGQVAVGARPVAVAVDQDGIWVANADDETVSHIDPDTLEVVRTIGIGVPASDIAVGEGSVWVASGSGWLVRIDPATDTVVDTLDLGGADELAPFGVYAVATGAGAVWVGSGSGEVLKIDPRTDEVLERVSIQETPVDIAFGAGDVWVVHLGGRVLRIEPMTAKVTGIVAAAPLATALAVGEGSVWVTDARPEGGGRIWRVDPVTATVLGALTGLPKRPSSAATGSGSVWVAYGPGGALIRIDPKTATVVGSVPVEHAPLDVAFGHGRVWLTVGTKKAAT